MCTGGVRDRESVRFIFILYISSPPKRTTFSLDVPDAEMCVVVRCHLGKTVLYDTVTKLDWSVSIFKHQISVMVDLLAEEQDWDSKLDDGGDESGSVMRRGRGDLQDEEKGKEEKEMKEDNGTRKHRTVPIATPEEDCIVSLRKPLYLHRCLTPNPMPI